MALLQPDVHKSHAPGALPHTKRGSVASRVFSLSKSSKTLIAAFAALTCSIATAQASTINVPNDYPTIQDGINAATTGDTVFVEAGFYSGPGNEDMDFGGKDIILQTDFDNPAVIDLDTSTVDHRAFYFHSGETSSAVIENFVIQYGYETNDYGAGIKIDGASPTISSCTFGGNTSETGQGAAIACTNGSPAIVNCGFYDGYANIGGAIVSIDASPTISKCFFTGNEANYGAGVAIFGDDTVLPTQATATIVNCVFAQNLADSDGSSIIVGGLSGSAVPILTAPVVQIDNCTITANLSFGDNLDVDDTHTPGTIASIGGALIISNSILYDNIYPSGCGCSPNTSTTFSTVSPPNAATFVQYSDLQGGYPGIGNLDIDPRLDFIVLTAKSPVINAGAVLLTTPPDDAAGTSRAGRTDLGALLYSFPVYSSVVSAYVNTAFNGEVAEFDSSEFGTDDDYFGAAGDFTATIDWGDGTTTSGTVSQPDGDGTPFHVDGTHTYAAVGAYPMVVSVTAVTANAPHTTETTNETADVIDTRFAVTASPTSGVAGSAFDITVTALDVNNNPITDYSGAVHLTSSDPLATLPSDFSLVDGVGTVSVTLYTAGDQTVTASDSFEYAMTGTSDPITITAGPATQLTVNANLSIPAGIPLEFVVRARDQYGNQDPTYTGTVHFTSTDPTAILPADTALVGGFGSFSGTLYTAAPELLRARDVVTSSITGTVSVLVTPRSAHHITVVAPSSTFTGVAFYASLYAKDIYGNTVTDYNNTVHITSTDSQAVLPADFVLTGGAKQVSIKLRTPGVKTFTATDTTNGSVSGTSGSITVSAIPAKLIVTAPVGVVAGTPATFTVTAKDSVGNTVPNYTGTVHITTSDANATLPADATLTNGVGSFSITFKTAASQSLTATDTVMSTIKGTAAGIVVSPGAATQFTLTAPASAVIGAAISSIVTAKDAYGNVAKGYTGTVHFTSTDALAVLPANTTLTSGAKQVSIKLKTAGSKTFTATDTVNAGITGTSPAVTVH